MFIKKSKNRRLQKDVQPVNNPATIPKVEKLLVWPIRAIKIIFC